MCACAGHNDEKKAFEKKFRLAKYFEKWWPSYCAHPKHFITPEQYKAVNAILTCRTPYLGTDYYACPDCGKTTEIRHSCKNRFCPSCSWKDTMEWAEKIKKRMMDIPHRHAVLTLPHQLNALVKNNGADLLNILMQTAAETFKDWMGHKYGTRPGIIEVLHTFGETKQYHPHVHMIVSWGGIDIKSGETKQIKGAFVNYKFLQEKFRCKFEDRLVEMFDDGKLRHGFKDRIDFLRHIRRINKNRWVIHLEPPMDIPEKVVRYIGRYSKRACLSEYKITKMDGENIAFRYKDYKNLDYHGKPIEKILEMNYRDFFPRLLQHVPIKGFRLVRYYGLYANKGNIKTKYREEEKHRENQAPAKEEKDTYRPLICKTCKKEMIYIHTVMVYRKNMTYVTYINPRLTAEKAKVRKAA